ncbi:hypothetical protein N7492_008690 [Penicillium capsulatum]|uniref:PARP-type domain-containing protein n=1 Tax=Penicillium capsulatum TaxID=69766 RepID=A0A9W9HSG1_9EURO|nr:hypothetical protein N7492_008690 [Penicillium capsulatum]KAJ6106094.1 hypothetical protein N7512_009611 [Penicillium capsulatum]
MPHRFEAASSGRAGCSNKECKDNKVKIGKGELRVGSWIENDRFQSWSWRHWGCTTPKVLENIKAAMEEMQGNSDVKDFSNLDGYDELPEEYQAKIRKALEQGHVDHEDWKGDPEMNVPGSIGFRVRGKKKKEADEAKKDEATAEAAETTESKPKAKKARATKAGGSPKASSDSEEKPAKKKTPRAKKAAIENASDADAEVKPKKRGRPAKSAPTEEKSAAKRKATNDDDNEAAAEDKPKPKRGRPAKAQKTQAENGDATAEKPKRGRKKADKKSEDH